MRSIKLKNGFTCKIDEAVFHKMRLLDAVERCKTDGAVISSVIRMIFGDNQTEILYEYIEKDGQDVTVEMMSDIIQEVSEAVGDQAKNS